MKDAAQWAGSSEDYIAQALLASVAGLCGQGVSARITEAWSEPVILWQALVGGPSSGKTPALEWLRRPLGTVEGVLAREGGAPVVVSDAALPALEKAVAKRRQGVLLWRDEPTAWLAGLGRKSRRDESRRGPFLDTWGAIGLPWGRGDKPAVSIVGSLDPERLDAALEDRRRPGRALPLCLAGARALPLAAHLEAHPRGRGGERAAAHRPRGRAYRRSRWCWPSRIGR